MKIYKLIGIDVSTKSIAFGILEEACYPRTYEIKAKGKKAIDRFPELIKESYLFLYKERPDVVYVEDIPFVRNPRATLDLAAILGAIRGLGVALSIPVYIVHNLTWKSHLGLKKPTKQDTADLLKLTIKIEDFNLLSDNEVDSLGIATYGWNTERAKRILET